MSKGTRDFNKMVRLYKEKTGITDADMMEVAAWLEKRGYEMPKPLTPCELLARKLSRAQRTEMRDDNDVGLPHRANHAYKQKVGNEYRTLWFDADSPAATFDKMEKASNLRRQQMVGDALQWTVDNMVWNKKHPDGEQLSLDTNLMDEVTWTLNGLKEQQKKKKAG